MFAYIWNNKDFKSDILMETITYQAYLVVLAHLYTFYRGFNG